MDLSEEIRAGARYMKRPVAVPVVFAKHAGMIQTLEGPVAYAPGDAILTGVDGERWPMPRARFDALYAQGQSHADGKDGAYVKRPTVVHAVQTHTPRQVALHEGTGVLHAEPGDWLVMDDTGSMWVVADVIFADTYAPAP